MSQYTEERSHKILKRQEQVLAWSEDQNLSKLVIFKTNNCFRLNPAGIPIAKKNVTFHKIKFETILTLAQLIKLAAVMNDLYYVLPDKQTIFAVDDVFMAYCSVLSDDGTCPNDAINHYFL